jgi:uncharacterized protein
MPRTFLTARWSHVCLFTYTVPPAMLEPRLPKGLSLDTRDGQAFVSLVAFNFLDTRVLGIPWPGYRNFPELNLRYYVREGEAREGEAPAEPQAGERKHGSAGASPSQEARRGVVFIREFVPQRLTAWLARTIYNEPYLTAPLRQEIRESGEHITAECRLDFAGQTHLLAVTGRKPSYLPTHDCTEHFFKEHQWGYGVDHKGRTIRYEVRHPLWEVYPVVSHRVELDWSRVYGSEWGFLQAQTPCSVVFAVGSEVAVWPKGRL